MSAKRKALDESGNGFVGEALQDLHIFAIRRRGFDKRWIVVAEDKNLTEAEKVQFREAACHKIRNLRHVGLVIVESQTPPSEYVERLNAGEIK